MFGQGFTCPALLEDQEASLPVRGCHPLWRAFPDASGSCFLATGLVRVRSSLLAESRLMSFPPATEIFQFAGFASCRYGFTTGYRLRGGLPHSEISGSTGARPFPELIAACHVLHRLSMPRHPPNALLISSPTPSPKRALGQPCGRPTPRSGPKPGASPLQHTHALPCRAGRRPGQAPALAILSSWPLHGHDSLHDVKRSILAA